MIPILLLVATVGCTQFSPYGRQQYGNKQYAASQTSIPPGKILVQDVRTGRLILIDDPNARSAPVQQPNYTAPAPQAPPARRPYVRAHRPPVPKPGVPAPMAPKRRIPRPENSLSLGVFMANVGGTLAGHDGYSPYEADLEGDLGVDGGAQITLEFTMQFPKGPRFRTSLSAIRSTGEVPADAALFPSVTPPISSFDEVETDIEVIIFDLAFCPMVRKAKWGTLSLETGLRYARSAVEIDNEGGQFAEGVMVTLGGEFELPVYKDAVSAGVKLGAGLGIDSAFIQFDMGISWNPTKRLELRLGYRFLGMVLVDRLEEPDERYLGITGGGLGLELGLNF
jgi:hypothetical protein